MTAAAPRVETTPEGVRVSGELTFAHAAQALQAMNAAVNDTAANGANARVLDLAGVTHSDSAGLACVLTVLAQAASHGRPFATRNLPEGMRLLAGVCEVESLIT